MTEFKKVLINNNYEIVLPKHRADRPEWYTEKGWEKKRLQSMHQHIGQDDVVFYVGSEEGEMPALCQMWGAQVVMFEPNDLVWPNTKAIWDANNLKNPLATFSGFASDKTTPGRSPIYVGGFPPSALGEVIHDHGFKEVEDNTNIPEVKIDDFVHELEIIPTAIAMDIEGSEWLALQGAELTLRKYKPKIWLSLHPEFLFRKHNKYSYEVRRWLMDIGYKEKLLDYDHEVHLYYE